MHLPLHWALGSLRVLVEEAPPTWRKRWALEPTFHGAEGSWEILCLHFCINKRTGSPSAHQPLDCSDCVHVIIHEGSLCPASMSRSAACNDPRFPSSFSGRHVNLMWRENQNVARELSFNEKQSYRLPKQGQMLGAWKRKGKGNVRRNKDLELGANVNKRLVHMGPLSFWGPVMVRCPFRNKRSPCFWSEMLFRQCQALALSERV